MNDIGTTAIQVSPEVPTEDEMNKVRVILERAINAIVGMSQLSADVDMLRQTVTSLQSDTERLRSQNAGLDEALFQARRTRQELEQNYSAQGVELHNVRLEHDRLAIVVRDDDTTINALRTQVHDAEQSRDDAELKAMDLEDQLKAAQAKLDAVREGYETLFGKPPQAVVFTPETNSVHEVPASAMPEMKPVIVEPEPDQDPVQAQPLPPAPVPRTYHGSHWAPGRIWDNTRKEYYDEIPF